MLVGETVINWLMIEESGPIVVTFVGGAVPGRELKLAQDAIQVAVVPTGANFVVNNCPDGIITLLGHVGLKVRLAQALFVSIHIDTGLGLLF